MMLITNILGRFIMSKNNHGITMTEDALKEWEQSFKDIEESIELVMESGEDL